MISLSIFIPKGTRVQLHFLPETCRNGKIYMQTGRGIVMPFAYMKVSSIRMENPVSWAWNGVSMGGRIC